MTQVLDLEAPRLETSILSAWRAKHGPEAQRVASVRAENDVITDLTADELGRRLGALATSYSGKAVTEQSARQVAAVYACVALIAGAVASLPLQVLERTATGSIPALMGGGEIHPYWWLLNEQPYEELSAADFWSSPASSMVTPSLRSCGPTRAAIALSVCVLCIRCESCRSATKTASSCTR